MFRGGRDRTRMTYRGREQGSACACVLCQYFFVPPARLRARRWPGIYKCGSIANETAIVVLCDFFDFSVSAVRVRQCRLPP